VKLVGKMDPYVKVKCPARNYEWKSSTCWNGSKHPKWNTEFIEFDVYNLDDEIKFNLWDEDKGKKDVRIGNGLSQCRRFA
jgi:Ca2+-dependent lipid-binding protein